MACFFRLYLCLWAVVVPVLSADNNMEFTQDSYGVSWSRPLQDKGKLMLLTWEDTKKVAVKKGLFVPTTKQISALSEHDRTQQDKDAIYCWAHDADHLDTPKIFNFSTGMFMDPMGEKYAVRLVNKEDVGERYTYSKALRNLLAEKMVLSQRFSYHFSGLLKNFLFQHQSVIGWGVGVAVLGFVALKGYQYFFSPTQTVTEIILSPVSSKKLVPSVVQGEKHKLLKLACGVGEGIYTKLKDFTGKSKIKILTLIDSGAQIIGVTRTGDHYMDVELSSGRTVSLHGKHADALTKLYDEMRRALGLR